jgi:hypothetical protein
MSERFPYNCLPVHVADSGVIAANEDIFNGDPQSDYVNLSNYDGVLFIIVKNAGAVGTAKLTVDAATDNAGSDTDNIGYRYLKVQDPGVPGDWTAVTYANADTGVTTAAEADCIYVIDVNRADMAPVSGAKYVSLTCTEVADGGVDGAICALLYGGKYGTHDPVATPNVTGD